jgi:hypothetical protein
MLDYRNARHRTQAIPLEQFGFEPKESLNGGTAGVGK